VKITGFWYVTPCTLTGTLNSEDGTSTFIHADYQSIRHHVCLMSINNLCSNFKQIKSKHYARFMSTSYTGTVSKVNGGSGSKPITLHLVIIHTARRIP